MDLRVMAEQSLLSNLLRAKLARSVRQTEQCGRGTHIQDVSCDMEQHGQKKKNLPDVHTLTGERN
jgi:hypothetical protein